MRPVEEITVDRKPIRIQIIQLVMLIAFVISTIIGVVTVRAEMQFKIKENEKDIQVLQGETSCLKDVQTQNNIELAEIRKDLQYIIKQVDRISEGN